MHPTSHSYATRVRHNLPIRPALHRSNSPSNSSPAHHPLPPFPPDNVFLHPDDAQNKVFLAIARSLLSVDNRAVTVKDLAEMVMVNGLVCQNTSAASQSITTYIREHLRRCEDQQDQPLLLRHFLSGTLADDDLAPALHTRAGGAHGSSSSSVVIPEGRTTNFRKGTQVWYLSRVTGAPCPFSRAGIRLSDYTASSNLRKQKAEGPRQRESLRLAAKDEQCGQKRKRASSRFSSAQSDGVVSDMEPPPKVKLTLRLKPLAQVTASLAAATPNLEQDSSEEDSDTDAISVDSDHEDNTESNPQPDDDNWCLPPYPRCPAISIPSYKPLRDSVYISYPSWTPYRCSRSPSVPYSVVSAPPDSDEDMDAWAQSEFDSSPDDFSSDGELDSSQQRSSSSPCPRSPPTSFIPLGVTSRRNEPRVKQEATDVQGLLDAWEENLDHHLGAAIDDEKLSMESAVKLENLATARLDSSWGWDSGYSDWQFSSVSPDIKQEDADDGAFTLHQTTIRKLDLGPAFESYRSPLSPFDATSPLTDNDQALSPCTPYCSPRESNTSPSTSTDRDYTTIRPRARTVPSLGLAGFFPTTQDPSTGNADATPTAVSQSPLQAQQSISSLIQSLSLSVATSYSEPDSSFCVSPRDINICVSARGNGFEPSALEKLVKGAAGTEIIVKTCTPSDPEIWATQVEGIPVYQTTLGSKLLLRRIDSDFVNLTPILTYARSPTPILSTIPAAQLIGGNVPATGASPSPSVQGIWVPLQSAQMYVKDHPLPAGKEQQSLNAFLDDCLVDRFPSALREYVDSNRRNNGGHFSGWFGKPFDSMASPKGPVGHSATGAESLLYAKQLVATGTLVESPVRADLPLLLAAAVASKSTTSSTSVEAELMDISNTLLPSPELPLSPTEQEIFREFCVPFEDSGPSSPASRNETLMEPDDSDSPLSPLSSIASPSGPISPFALPIAAFRSSTGSLSAKASSEVDRATTGLRRSQRVANANAKAAQSKTRSRKRSSRNSS